MVSPQHDPTSEANLLARRIRARYGFPHNVGTGSTTSRLARKMALFGANRLSLMSTVTRRWSRTDSAHASSLWVDFVPAMVQRQFGVAEDGTARELRITSMPASATMRNSTATPAKAPGVVHPLVPAIASTEPSDSQISTSFDHQLPAAFKVLGGTVTASVPRDSDGVMATALVQPMSAQPDIHSNKAQSGGNAADKLPVTLSGRASAPPMNQAPLHGLVPKRLQTPEPGAHYPNPSAPLRRRARIGQPIVIGDSPTHDTRRGADIVQIIESSVTSRATDGSSVVPVLRSAVSQKKLPSSLGLSKTLSVPQELTRTSQRLSRRVDFGGDPANSISGEQTDSVPQGQACAAPVAVTAAYPLNVARRTRARATMRTPDATIQRSAESPPRGATEPGVFLVEKMPEAESLSDAPSTRLEVAHLTEKVYQMLVDRLRTEKERRGF
jgi:hypothetical protein